MSQLMPDQTSPDQPSPTQGMPDSAAAAPAAPSYVLTTSVVKGPTINIGEEYGTAKKNLPPAKILLITIAAVVVVVLVASFLKRAKPQASGSLDNVAAVELAGQGSTMAALTFTIRHTSDKVLYVRGLQGTIKPAAGDGPADALSAMDFDRYFQA